MPKGPRGEKRPPDVIGNAVKVMRIATGEETEELTGKAESRVERGRRGGLIGGKSRAERVLATRRVEIARNAARARWRKS
jgi:hypothetical protein